MYSFTKFVGTRGGSRVSLFSDAIMNPSANYGGLWAPEVVPQFDEETIKSMINLSYKNLALEVLREFGVDILDSVIKKAVDVYDQFDDPETPVPVKTVKKDLHVAELYHGLTRAFKDMALAPFPNLVSELAQAENDNYLVLAATSGDTGPAALSGFRNLANTRVVCLYPDGGTSDVQKQQMVTEDGDNLKVIGVKGNFDDTQNALKEMINSQVFRDVVTEKGYKLSAANSVNFGRIIFQIVYHFWSYFELVRKGKIEYGDEITVVIPSGNFGNGLAAFYAKLLGLPIEKIVLASNDNDVLTDFIRKGRYDLRFRDLVQTNSPAMDILVSSNIERLLFHLFGCDITHKYMEDLNDKNFFELTKAEHQIIKQVFDAEFATNNEVIDTIGDVFNIYNYDIDPHTATAFVVHKKLKLTGTCLIASTAEWTKFVETMSEALGCLSSLDSVSRHLAVSIPKPIADLENKPIVHTDVVEIDEIQEKILASIGYDIQKSPLLVGIFSILYKIICILYKICYTLYKFIINLYKNMNTVAIGEFRAKLSSYLKQLDDPSQVLSFGHRNKKEYLVSKFPEIEEGFDIFKYQAGVIENNLQKDYYKSLSTNYSDWSDTVHDDLFKEDMKKTKYNSGDIVIINNNNKLRPALVISNKSYNKHDNLMLIGIYGNKGLNQYSSKISQEDLKHGKLKKDSYFRLHNIFSLHKSLIVSKVAELENKKIKELKNKLCDFMD